MTHHKEASAQIAVTADRLFAYLDDHTRLASHMSRPSMMMGGGRMTYEFDPARGQAVGSHIRMGGNAFGLKLFVDEVVTERQPPRRKVWQTVADPKLIVIGQYRMGFEVTPASGGAALRVWIDYDLPPRGPGRLIPALADVYARWCVRRMVDDARSSFDPAEGKRAGG